MVPGLTMGGILGTLVNSILMPLQSYLTGVQHFSVHVM